MRQPFSGEMFSLRRILDMCVSTVRVARSDRVPQTASNKCRRDTSLLLFRKRKLASSNSFLLRNTSSLKKNICNVKNIIRLLAIIEKARKLNTSKQNSMVPSLGKQHTKTLSTAWKSTATSLKIKDTLSSSLDFEKSTLRN